MTIKRFECLEPGCDVVIERAGEDELIGAVQQHMGDAHDTFELEDVILANSVDVEN